MTSLRASLSLVVLAGLFATGCSALSPSTDTADGPAEVASDSPAADASVAEEPVIEDDAAQVAAPATVQNLDTTVVPGERVGPITPTTSRQELAALFGEERLTDTEVDVGEGMTEAGTEIALSDDETLSILWVDSTQSRVQEVRELGPMWQTPEGIRVGMPLDELQQVAGTFEIYGFGWDYGGTVLLTDSQISQYDGTLILRLGIDEGAAEANPQAYQAVIGSTPYASTEQGFDTLEPYINEMIVTLTPFGE